MRFSVPARGLVAAIVIALYSLDAAFGQCGPWGQPRNLSNDAGRYAVDPHMVIDDNGHVHVIYQSFLDSSGRNYYTTNAGGMWSAPSQLSGMGGKGSAPKIVLTPDGQLHTFAGKNTIYWRTRPVSGGTWSAPELIGYSTGDFIYGAVVDDTGGIYYMWGHLFDSGLNPRNGIWGRYKPLGEPWGPIELIYGNGDDGNWPRGDHLAVKGNTLWVAIGVDGRTYFKRKPAGGTWPSGKGMQFHDEGGGLHFAFDRSSNEIAGFWTESFSCDGACEDDAWYEVFVRYSHDDGATWSASENISDNTDDIDRTVYGTYDFNGDLHVAWEGFCCDHRLRLRYRARIGGTWGAIQDLTPNNVSGLPWDALKSDGNRLLLAYNLTGSGMTGLYDVFFRENQASLPWINVSPTSIERSVWVGSNLPSESFTVTNACTGVLDYTVTEGADWLEVSPSGGSSGTDVDMIELAYDLAERPAGIYQAGIIISGNTNNDPQIIPVTITIETVRPDFDGDGDVDQADFGHLQSCLSGEFLPQDDPDCQNARLDADEDVDVNDFAILQACLTSPGVPAEADCD